MKTCERCLERPAEIETTEVSAEGVQALALCHLCARNDLSMGPAARGDKTGSELPAPLAFDPVKGYGFLRRLRPESPTADDVYVPASIARRFALEKGDLVSGRIRPPREDERYQCLVSVSAVECAQK